MPFNRSSFIILFIIITLSSAWDTLGQSVGFEATIENRSVIGTDYYFDIYLTQNGSENLYLSGAQFILTFNNKAFTNPAISKQSESLSNFISQSGYLVGPLYRNNTDVLISDSNKIIIQIGQILFDCQSEFENNVAKIDNQIRTHRVGRYKISGISDPGAKMGLQWVSSLSIKAHSKVFTFAASDRWNSTEANGKWENPISFPLTNKVIIIIVKQIDEQLEVIWQTKSDKNCYGYEIERSLPNVNDTANGNKFQSIGFINEVTLDHSSEMKFVDKCPVKKGTIIYRVKYLDKNGISSYSNEESVVIIPKEYNLSQNYPNPFNPNTTIEFDLPTKSYVNLKVYDILGREVTTLLSEERPAGNYKVQFWASKFGLSSGQYFYQLKAGNFIKTNKMIFQK